MDDRAQTTPSLPGQVVLVLQGGGALGAYQGGVYQALHEAGIEPNWVIGTSIGAINGAIIAGNEPGKRLNKVSKFWDRMERKPIWGQGPLALMGGNAAAQMMTIFGGIGGYFTPNRDLAWGLHAPIGVERAGFYTIEALHETLNGVVDFSRINSGQPRLTVGAVNVRSGRMHYFDSRNMPITLKHVLASGALPPAFPAVCIDGDPYWDGGIYSNTPIETVFDDHPRRDSIVFTVQMWHAEGPEPESVWQVLNRQKDIQFASRADSHIARQCHIHHFRHVIRELVRLMPEAQRETPEVKEMAGMDAARSCTSCGLKRHASITKIICATSILPALESIRAGRRALLIPRGCSSGAPGKRQSTQWRALQYTIPIFSRNQASTSQVMSPPAMHTPCPG